MATGSERTSHTPRDTGNSTVASNTDSSPSQPFTFDDVSVVMGTYNEEAAIEAVINDINAATESKAEIVCVDGSTDQTPRLARSLGARVIPQEPKGYGVAVREALSAASRSVIITTDCDDTYPMAQLPAFLARINEGYDVVSGNRLSGDTTAMPRLNRLGNRVFGLTASLLVRSRVHDVTTGMRAYRRPVIEGITWTENTGLSAELVIRPILRGYDVIELPIEYDDRVGESTLNPVTGGLAIATSILKVGLAEHARKTRDKAAFLWTQPQ